MNKNYALRREIEVSADNVIPHIGRKAAAFEDLCKREGERIQRLFPKLCAKTLGGMVYARAVEKAD